MTEAEPNIIEQRGQIKVLGKTSEDLTNFMKLNRYDVLYPDGNRGQRVGIEFHKGAVQVYPTDNEGNIYLAREYTFETDRDSLETGGGVINEGETPEQAAMRKAKDEMGIELEEGSLVLLNTYGEITSIVKNLTHAYWGKVKRVGDTPKAGDNIRVQKMPLSEAVDRILSREIYTGVVAAAIWHINYLANNPPRPQNP
jgi:ADP-ribose pyrophosphatase YjhB (NUDIX family)